MIKKQKENSLGYNDLKGWRKTEGEEQAYIKGILIKSLSDSRWDNPILVGSCLFFFIFFLITTIDGIGLIINQGISSKKIIYVLFMLSLTISFGIITFIFKKDKRRKECIKLIYSGNMEVLDVTILNIHSNLNGSGIYSAEVKDLNGNICHQFFTCCTYERNLIKEGLLIKVMRSNSDIPDFWVIPVYIKNGRTCQFGLKYLEKFNAKHKYI